MYIVFQMKNYSKALMYDALEDYFRMNKKTNYTRKDETWEQMKFLCDKYNIDLDTFKIKRKEKSSFEREWAKWVK